MLEPNMGDWVQVRPRAPTERVQHDGGAHGNFMPNEWQDRLWNEWLHRRLRDGAIEIRPVPAEPVEPVEAPSDLPRVAKKEK